MEDFEKEAKICEAKKDVERTDCSYGVLHRLTRLQDDIQLGIPAINESAAISNEAINKANAIILEMSKWKGDLEPIITYGYFLEKASGMADTYNAMARDFGVMFNGSVPMIEFKIVEKDFSDVPESVRISNQKEIFRNIRFDSSKNKLEKVV